MRVISGEYRGRRLKALEGKNTRPTTDKVKESIFNIIGPYFQGGCSLDLFAGSGALTIEALSRGIEKAVCVDHHPGAIKIIKENLSLVRAQEAATVLKMEANQALERLKQEGWRFDLVLFDPPYAKQDIVSQMEKMVQYQLLNEDCCVVCETDKQVALPDEVPGFQLRRRATYGMTEVVVYYYVGETND